MSVPNQRNVTIGRRTPRNAQNLYATINIDALQLATKLLNSAGLKMWLYFNKNQEHYSFELSLQACLNWGIKKDSYYNGLKELISKGYLVQDRWQKNRLIFYEEPQPETQNDSTIKKEFSEQTNFTPEKSNYQQEKQNIWSEIPQRNNTILQNNKNNTMSKEIEEGYKALGF